MNDSNLKTHDFEKETLKFYEGKTILVTGAAGFLGSNLISHLSDSSCKILAIYRKEKPSITSKLSQVTFLQGDVREREIWESAIEGVDVVFHFAGQTSVAVAEKDPHEDFTANVLPLLHLLNICRERKLKPAILFAGTVTSFGITKIYPVDETFESKPATAYCLNKLSAEEILKKEVDRGSVTGASLRLPNIYGPGAEVSSSDRGILNKVMRMALAGETLTIYGAGEHIRDYLFVRDAIMAFLSAGVHAESLKGQFYVIGTGQPTTISQAFHMAAERASRKISRPVPVEYKENPEDMPAIETRDFSADYSRFQELTGWRPVISLQQGIDRTLESMS